MSSAVKENHCPSFGDSNSVANKNKEEKPKLVGCFNQNGDYYIQDNEVGDLERVFKPLNHNRMLYEQETYQARKEERAAK